MPLVILADSFGLRDVVALGVVEMSEIAESVTIPEKALLELEAAYCAQAATELEVALSVAVPDALAQCGSPIELSLLAALWAKCVPSYVGVEIWFHAESAWLVAEEASPNGCLLRITPQFRFGRKRIDFHLAGSRFPTGGERDWCYLLVECDGHDFHERTKEQAAKDKRRDRELLRDGYMVMRFTGSEIYRDAAACASECLDYIMPGVMIPD